MLQDMVLNFARPFEEFCIHDEGKIVDMYHAYIIMNNINTYQWYSFKCNWNKFQPLHVCSIWNEFEYISFILCFTILTILIIGNIWRGKSMHVKKKKKKQGKIA